MKTPAKTFGQNLATLRTTKKLTQETVAELVGVHWRHYQKLEAGTVSPSFRVIIAAKKALKCQWNELLDGIESTLK